MADFSGGTLSSDGGALLLRQVDRALGLTRGLAACFDDRRDPVFAEHALTELLPQRLYAEALGDEDVNDRQQLRRDPLLAAACGKKDPLGGGRPYHPAAPATLHRLELSNNKSTRSHKLPRDPQKIEAWLLEVGARCLPKSAVEIVIDLDARGHRLHGLQEGRQFNAYYDDYVYLPLYAFVGNLPLWAPLRTADHGAAHGVVAALEKMVRSLRKRCPQARLMIRGDSGFFGDELMSWREARREVYYCVGLAKNSVLIEEIQPALAEARARRVIGKAEVSAPGDNPRFLVTSLPAAGFPGDEDATRFSPQRLYEEL